MVDDRGDDGDEDAPVTAVEGRRRTPLPEAEALTALSGPLPRATDDTVSSGSMRRIPRARMSFSMIENRVQLAPAGYELQDTLGKGGMGEVIAAHDLKFDRDIAIKRMHGEQSTRSIARFLREARIQARLEHPAIVPIHDLGTDAEGRVFFTMKRLAGVTLSDKLETDPVQSLLRAFVEVLLAIDFAHQRRVVHRDLKPANIMLGDFGEVYVLDWGVARELDASDDLTEPGAGETEVGVPASETATKAGAVLGTPGYMAPEQVRGEPAGTAADIYALGAILFEILTTETLHPRGDDALVSTLTGSPERPAMRRPDREIAPELDELCLAAQAEDPAERPTARAMVERLRRYMDGDRDLALRRTLRDEQIALAHAALSTNEQVTAMRHAGRALALDPESEEAAGLVGRLLLERPAVLPPALVESLDQLDRDALRKRSQRATRSYGAVFVFLLLLPLLDVRSWPWLVGFNLVLATLVAFAWRGSQTGRVSPYLSMLGNFALALVWTRIASPFVLTPVMICGALIAVASHPWNQERPWTIFAWAAVTATTPLLLEYAGVLDPTWTIDHTGIHLTSTIYNFGDNLGASVAVVFANVMFIMLVGAFAYTITRNGRTASRDHHMQAWHLRNLIPEKATHPTAASLAPPSSPPAGSARG
jgi:serine/threonine protein kinase